jgi:serine protease Do
MPSSRTCIDARRLVRCSLRAILIAALSMSAGCRRPTKVKAAPVTCSPPAAVTITSAPSTAAPAIGGAPDVAALVAKVTPAVINVTTTQDLRLPRTPIDPDGPYGDVHRESLGSGFIVDPRGYAVTNAHVVEGADRVRVRLADERELPAKVKGRDERNDVALLEIENAKDLPAVTLGSSDALRVGDYVIAIGNPFGLGHTVTMGIVSGKGREIGAGPYDDFIQTDTSINPGSSGGPLFNVRGEVIGINTAISAAGQGIGFASPIDALKDVLPQLVTKGHVDRGRLGVLIQRVDSAMARAVGMDRAHGALLGDLDPAGPAARAGLHPGDIVLSVGGTEIGDAHELPRVVGRRPPGAKVNVEVLRDKAKRTFGVVLDALEDESAKRDSEHPSAEPPKGAPVATFGMELQDRGGEGVVVRRVRPRSPADGVLEPGDVLLEIDRKPVRNAAEATRELALPRSSPVILRIRRDGVSGYVTVEP